MESFSEHWEKWIFLFGLAAFFWQWRAETKRAEERQSERDKLILGAITELREQMAKEHGELGRMFERLDEHTVIEHRSIAESLGRLATSLEHHIADERVKR